MIDVNKAIQAIKGAGQRNVRTVPMPNNSVMDGDYQIEVQADGSWKPLVTGVKKKMAEDIIAQAVNRTILG